jgi:hypothetical protein
MVAELQAEHLVWSVALAEQLQLILQHTAPRLQEAKVAQAKDLLLGQAAMAHQAFTAAVVWEHPEVAA